MTTRHDAVAGGHTSNAQQLLDRARKEQADLQLVLAKNQYVIDQMQCVLDQARDMLDRTQRMLNQKTQEVNALVDAVKDEQDETPVFAGPHAAPLWPTSPHRE
ncbi:hypothetical protein N7494_005576 [Penicillium frequentans]|uniref:Uncharacterized protein n=1 Tax=Penicillium frequentans TaxID=3151616 RepID=A0AAD6CUK8_9EURO|nr:hypothetical protein N7494_005576 [Penicillium glabrum]